MSVFVSPTLHSAGGEPAGHDYWALYSTGWHACQAASGNVPTTGMLITSLQSMQAPGDAPSGAALAEYPRPVAITSQLKCHSSI